MQIAKIVPNTKTTKGGVFDYAIPPEILPDIKIGILVLIPFHGRKIEGVIVDLKANSRIIRLKSIIKIIDPNPVIDGNHIKLADWMAKYYLTSIGQTLFENIVPPAKRSIKKETQNIFYKNSPLPTLNNRNNAVIVQGDFSSRIKYYLTLSNQIIAKKKSVIILVPDLSLLKYFSIFKHTIKISSEMTVTERWKAWNTIRKSPFSTVIGSQSAIFAPVNNLGLIIIDQVDNETYKNDRTPRFLVSKVADYLSKITGAKLIYGSLTPPIELLYENNKNIVSLPRVNNSGFNISIVDMNYEKSIISATLEKITNQMIQNNKKVLMVLNRKGEGYLKCTDCGWTYNCDSCNLPLKPTGIDGVCYRCNKKFPVPSVCLKCGNINLKFVGLGTNKLAGFVKKVWPNLKIMVLEKDVVNLPESYDIIIATEYALKFPLSNIGLVALIDPDLEINLPDIYSFERAFMNYFKFLNIGKKGLIQTHLPNSNLIKSLANLDFNKFYQSEIRERKLSNFPPFAKLIRLIFTNNDKVICENETLKVATNLKIFLSESEILGPSPTYYPKIRNKYKFHILLKLKSGPSDDLKTYLQSLGNNWAIDVDPISLL